METETSTTTDTIYTETAGTTCYVAGQRGTVTGLHRVPRGLAGAFVKLDSDGSMLFVKLGQSTGERDAWHTVTGHHAIDRAEFDRITGLDALAADLGWR